MPQLEPVLLTVLVETARFRWFAAGIDLHGKPEPLLRSADGSLESYVTLPFDEQLSFLRHRFSGTLQRGADRLWARQQKAIQFVFVADACFVQATPELTKRLAEHMVDWMVRPPVAYFLAKPGLTVAPTVELEPVAGALSAEHTSVLQLGLSSLIAEMQSPSRWELVATPRC
jgi:hypothetical protein